MRQNEKLYGSDKKKFVTPLGGVVSVYVKWVSEEMFSAANSVSKWLS